MFIDEKRQGEAIGRQIEHPSVEGFIWWLGTKDPEATYKWPHMEECACCQYAAAVGKLDGWMNVLSTPWQELNYIARGDYARDWTFGACLHRAKRWAA